MTTLGRSRPLDPRIWAQVPLTGPGLQRAAAERADPGLLRRLLDHPGTVLLHVHGHDLAFAAADAGSTSAAIAVFLGREGTPGDEAAERAPTGDGEAAARPTASSADQGNPGGGTAYIGLLHDAQAPRPRLASSAWVGLRELAGRLCARDAAAAATVTALANWHASHPRCPRCGSPTDVVQAGWVRECPQDGSQHFPRTDPAVIMAVTDADDRLLLARGPHAPESRMTVLAGFVEPGETLAQAVVREVDEEVGVAVAVEDVCYVADQPWPFPSSLMVGFRARARARTAVLRPQDGEIVEARWFTRPELAAALAGGQVRVPPRLSISRRLIEDWFGDLLPDPRQGGVGRLS